MTPAVANVARNLRVNSGLNRPESHIYIYLPNVKVKEFEETYRQIEEDCDQEILDLKWKYETILKRERDANFRLKAESGLIRFGRGRRHAIRSASGR